ncbi:MAG: 2-phospho-L-lactate guanylyltransferase [Candidatus Thorarchaeota archaeon]|nr:2-phospho-L-lactate guanylyltransferase [Candidatus Thorarchaeota archaeon]
MTTQSSHTEFTEAGKAVAVVPLKKLNHAKSRLAPILDSEQRRQFALSMLEDVLGTLRDSEAITTILVVTKEAGIVSKLNLQGLDIWTDSSDTDLNSALRAATTHVRRHYGEQPLLIIPADVPLVTKPDIKGILSLGKDVDPPVVVAAPSDNGGTSALLRIPPNALGVQFGPSSFKNHQMLARESDVTFLAYQSPTLGLDIDTPDDVKALLQYPADNIAIEYLQQSKAIQSHGWKP